jgi:hypothetical protein
MSEQSIGLPEYLEKECEYLRTRLSTNIDETAALERLAITATGGLWAWIGTHGATAVPVLFWLPLLLTLFLGFRAIAVYLRIKSIRTYLAKLEAAANVPRGLGWIACLEGSGGRYRVLTANLFWAGINLVNLGLALIARSTPTPL